MSLTFLNFTRHGGEVADINRAAWSDPEGGTARPGRPWPLPFGAVTDRGAFTAPDALSVYRMIPAKTTAKDRCRPYRYGDVQAFVATNQAELDDAGTA